MWPQNLETSESSEHGGRVVSCSVCSLSHARARCCISYLYQIAHLGDDDDEPEFSSAMPLEEGDTFFFQPRPLKNLVLVDEQESLSPIMSCQVGAAEAKRSPRPCFRLIGLPCLRADC